MPNIYKIFVNNHSPDSQTLFFFQEPAIYAGGPKIYTNSLASAQIAAKPTMGMAQVQFAIELQYYAGVQSQTAPLRVGHANLDSIAIMPITLTSKGTELNATRMSTKGGLAMTNPANNSEVEDGAFRIVTPTFNPLATPYNAGLAAVAQGELVLSNFIVADPNKDIDVQPIVKFHVATGSYRAGTVVNFDTVSVNSAVCDATSGQEEFFVTYNVDGTWTVK